MPLLRKASSRAVGDGAHWDSRPGLPNVSAKDIARIRTGTICVLQHQTTNKAFLNYVHKSRS
jgi:hypothetical protein